MIVALIALVFAMTGTGIAARGLITGKQIKDRSITARDLAPGSVTANALATSAVTRTKLARGAVGGDRIAPGGVGSAALTAGAVTGSALAPNAVTSDALAPGSVLGADLAAGSVTRAALADGAVNTSALADGAVNFPKLATITEAAARQSSRSRSSTSRSYGQSAGIVCPNGIITYSYPCPTVVTSGKNTGSMTSGNLPSGLPGWGINEPLDCTIDGDANWVNTSGPQDALVPAPDKKTFVVVGSGVHKHFNVTATFGNVDRNHTKIMGVGLTGRSAGGLLKDLGFTSLQGSSIQPGSDTASVSFVIVNPVATSFSASVFACNSQSSQIGPPTVLYHGAQVNIG